MKSYNVLKQIIIAEGFRFSSSGTHYEYWIKGGRAIKVLRLHGKAKVLGNKWKYNF